MMKTREEKMRAEIERSHAALLQLVWPALADQCSGGDLVTVEGMSDHAFQGQLDRIAGIDAWQVVPALGQMRGVASRVQFGDHPWNTFTIRAGLASGNDTELQKRMAAVSHPQGWLFPALTIQAYVSADGKRLLSAAAIRTEVLYGYLGGQLSSPELRRAITTKHAHMGGNPFYVIPWSILRTASVQFASVS